MLRQAQKESMASGDKILLVNVETTLGQTLIAIGQDEEGVQLLNKSLETCARLQAEGEKMGPLLSQAYNGLGIYQYTVRGNYYLGKEYFLKAIEEAKKCKEEKLYRRFETNLIQVAIMERDTSFHSQAHSSYRQAKDVGDSYTQFITATNLAQMELFAGNTTQAEALLREAKNIADREGIRDMVSYYLTEAGLFEKKGDIAGAVRSLDLADKSISSSTDAPHNRVLVASHRLKLYMNHKDFRQALVSGKEALRLSDALHQRGQYDIILLQISHAYEQLGHRDSALFFARRYEQFEDSTIAVDREYMIRDLATAYHVESVRQEAQTARQLLNTERQRNLFLIIGLLLLAIVTGVVIRNYLVKSRLHRKVVSLYKELLDKEKQEHERTILAPSEVQSDSVIETDDIPVFPHVEEPAGDTNSLFEKIWSDFCALIESTPDMNDSFLNRDNVADRLNTNHTYLAKVVKDKTGKSYSQYINYLRVKKAITILSDPAKNDIPIKAVGANLGFGSLNAFYSNFKAVTGISPASFRKSAAPEQR